MKLEIPEHMTSQGHSVTLLLLQQEQFIEQLLCPRSCHKCFIPAITIILQLPFRGSCFIIPVLQSEYQSKEFKTLFKSTQQGSLLTPKPRL